MAKEKETLEDFIISEAKKLYRESGMDARLAAMFQEAVDKVFTPRPGRRAVGPSAVPPSYDPYIVLGVSRSVSNEEVRSAFRVQAQKLHPDHQGGDESRFKLMHAAYRAICRERGIE